MRLASDAASRCLDSASTTNVHVTSTPCRLHLRRPPAERRGKTRRRPASSSGGCALDGALAGFGSIDACGRRNACVTRAPALFRLTEGPVDRDLWHLSSDGRQRGTKPCLTSGRLVTVHRGHVNDGGSSGTEVPSIARDRGGRPCESPSQHPAPAGRPGQWPRVFCRRSKAPTRPLLTPLSRRKSRPRTLLRLLQVDVSTSTTTVHPNISTTGSAVGTTARFERKSPSVRGCRQRCSGSGAEQPMLDTLDHDCS